MKPKLIYEWDIIRERSLSFEKIKLMDEVSSMLKKGCKIKELNGKMKMLNL